VIDISDIENQNITEIGSFDTFPVSNDAGFDGAWSVYPYFDSGNIIISDINTGFYLVKENSLGIAELDHEELKVYPNPATEEVKIQTTDHQLRNVKIFAMNGRLVRSYDNLDDDFVNLNIINLSKGVYIMQINENSKHKLIVQ